MDRKKIRDAALDALLSGGSYREVVETEVTLEALDSAPEIPLNVPIRFQRRYEEMTETDAPRLG